MTGAKPPIHGRTFDCVSKIQFNVDTEHEEEIMEIMEKKKINISC